MFSLIDQNKFLQLGIGIIGLFSVYIIHSIIYEGLIMAPFKNSITQKKQYFNSEAGFIFLQKIMAWMLAQIFAFVVLKKQERAKVPHRYGISGGFCVFLSSIMFTTGIFQLNFRLSISNRTSTFLIVTVIGYLVSPYTSPSKTPKFRDLFSGLGIGLGVIIFWMFGEDLWIYTPDKNGYIYNWMIISSGICDGVLAIIQSRVCQKYRPSQVQLLVTVSRWTALCCFIYALVVGDLHMTLQFCYFHREWMLSMLGLGCLYFVGQLFIYRVTTKMAQNVPAFLTTSRKVLTIHQSYILSNHKISKQQEMGMMISWISIIIQVILFAEKEQTMTKQFQKLPHHQVQITQLPSQDPLSEKDIKINFEQKKSKTTINEIQKLQKVQKQNQSWS